MNRFWIAGLLAMLAGCSEMPRAQVADGPCSAGEAAYACQVQRYQDVNAP